MKITNSRLAFEKLRRLMVSDVEEFWVVALRADKTVITCQLLFRGTVDACLVHPRDIFRFACEQNASGVLLAHNHPSEDPLPSKEDVRLTRQIVKAGEILQIPVIDHLIITKDTYASLADLGLI